MPSSRFAASASSSRRYSSALPTECPMERDPGKKRESSASEQTKKGRGGKGEEGRTGPDGEGELELMGWKKEGGMGGQTQR